jgi:hypothetical protein
MVPGRSQEGQTTTSWGCFRILKSEAVVPISAPGLNSRNEKHMEISIVDWKLHLPGK